MSQDAWINAVRAEVEESPQFRALHDMITGWYLRPHPDIFEPPPAWHDVARAQLATIYSAVGVAEEAGRRYQCALRAWQYRQG